MTVVQPRNIVQPTPDFEMRDGGRRLVYRVKPPGEARWVIIVILSFLALIAGVLSVLIDMRGLALACAFAIFFLIRWGITAGKEKTIEFDEKSITVDGKTYLLDHVSSIGWRAGDGFYAGGAGMQGTGAMIGAMAGQALSGQIYMQYGADEVIILKGLSPNNVEAVYNRIVGFLEKFGRKFS
jgi:hypothetical protein